VAAPTDQKLIAALDIGSSKVSALIVTPEEDGRLRVLGTGQRESRGVKRGFITDMEASEHAVREAVELAERMSTVTVEEVWASFGAGSLVSDIANVEVELGGHQVEQADIDELLSAGRNAIDGNGQVVLHAHPALYTIDRAQGVQQPIGLFAHRLGVDIHVIAADPAPLRNIDYVIRSAHLGVAAVVASPVARQSRDDRSDADGYGAGRGADTHHPGAADDGHSPARRGTDQPNRVIVEGAWLHRARRPAGGADRRRRRTEEHRRLYAGRARPGGAHRSTQGADGNARSA
jgi:hypothetical protein